MGANRVARARRRGKAGGEVPVLGVARTLDFHDGHGVEGKEALASSGLQGPFNFGDYQVSGEGGHLRFRGHRIGVNDNRVGRGRAMGAGVGVGGIVLRRRWLVLRQVLPR